MKTSHHASDRETPVVLLHGFLGTPRDWDAFLNEFRSGSCAERIAVDLVDVARRTIGAPTLGALASTIAADLRRDARCAGGFGLIGYSLGGRIAMEWSRACSVDGAAQRARPTHVALLSANPGIDAPNERTLRAAADDHMSARLAALARVQSLEARRQQCGAFLSDWYGQPLFESLRSQSGFADLARQRCEDLASADNASIWAAILEACSPGRSPSCWEHLASRPSDFSMIVGAMDDRYCAVAARARSIGIHAVVVPDAGHALHIEQPSIVARLALDARREFAQRSLAECQSP